MDWSEGVRDRRGLSRGRGDVASSSVETTKTPWVATVRSVPERVAARRRERRGREEAGAEEDGAPAVRVPRGAGRAELRRVALAEAPGQYRNQRGCAGPPVN